MKKHIKIYFDFYGYGEQSKFLCEYCLKRSAVGVHHIVFRSQGGKDEIENLIGLCQICHNLGHGKISKRDRENGIIRITKEQFYAKQKFRNERNIDDW